MSNPTELPIDLIHDFRDAINIAHHRADHVGDSVRKRRWQDVSKRLEIYAAARRAQPEGEAPQAKDTPESMAQSNARFAIDGAIQYGRENRNEPPSTEHWLYEYWNIGRQLAQLGATGWDNVTPAPAATLSPLCGAQHADRALLAEVLAAHDQRTGVETAAMGFGLATNPLMERVRAALAAQQAAAPGALAAKPLAYAIHGIVNGKHRLHDVRQIEPGDGDNWKIDDGGLGDYWSGNEPLFAPSAPGTPEAPKGGV